MILLDDPNAASLLFTAVLDTLTLPLSLFSSHQNLCIHLIQCLSEARKHGTYATLSSLAPYFAAYLAPYLPVFLLVWSRWDYSSWPFRKWSAFSGCTKKQLRLKQFCSDAERIEHRDTLWHTQRYRADLYEACLKRWTILDRNFNDISMIWMCKKDAPQVMFRPPTPPLFTVVQKNKYVFFPSTLTKVTIRRFTSMLVAMGRG